MAYGTFLGGAGLDQALAISVGAAMPATAYVTGTTQSTNFPTNGTNAAAQSTLKGTAKGSANAFFSAIAQNATTGMTSLLYSTYLGGTQSDSGLSVAALASNALYISGKTTSWDFPWLNNLQPFTGNEDAFVAKFDPTTAGPASLIYATPLAGTAPPGSTAVTDGNAIAADALGDVYVAGRSTSADFPSGANLSTGLQTICSSCQQLPPAADAFVLAFHESANSAPSLSFTTLNMNFGAQPVGAQNIPPLFSALINTGDAPLNVSNIALSGPNVSSFSIVGSDPCIGTPMPPRATCSFEISFSPTAVGPAEAFATITDDAPGSPHVLSVVGIGSGALAVLSSTSLSFGNQPQGSISASKAVTLFNQGNQPLTVTNLAPTGADANQFALQSNNCDSNSIAGGASCTINVVFAPQGTASYQAEIDIIDNSGGLTAAKQVIALSGTGVAASPIANLSPASLTFGTLAVGTTSGPQPITLRNLGSAALTLSQLTFTGSDAASFAVAPTGTTCPIGSTVAIGANCLVQIVFAPQTSGAKSATVNFVDNASGSPQSISLSGTAIAPTLQISPGSLTFAAQSVGTPSPSQTIMLSNTGTSSVTINGITVTGPNAADFSENGNCSAVLGAGASCQLTVIFKPVAAGNRSASISISDDAAGNPHSVPVAGTATQAAVSLSPSTVNFANQLVGTTSPPAPTTVTNTGTGALVIASISFSGANAADFTQKNTCTAPIAPAASCLINVTFAPTAVGARTASMTIADNASNAPQSSSSHSHRNEFRHRPAQRRRNVRHNHGRTNSHLSTQPPIHRRLRRPSHAHLLRRSSRSHMHSNPHSNHSSRQRHSPLPSAGFHHRPTSNHESPPVTNAARPPNSVSLANGDAILPADIGPHRPHHRTHRHLDRYQDCNSPNHKPQPPGHHVPPHARPPNLNQTPQPQPSNYRHPSPRSNPHRTLLRHSPPHNPNLLHPTRHLHPHPNIHRPPRLLPPNPIPHPNGTVT